MFEEDEVLQEINEEIVANVKDIGLPRTHPLEVQQVELLNVLLPQNAYCGSEAKQIVVVKVHEGRSRLQFDSVHLFAAEIDSPSEGCKGFIVKVLFDYLAESEVEEDESSELIAEG